PQSRFANRTHNGVEHHGTGLGNGRTTSSSCRSTSLSALALPQDGPLSPSDHVSSNEVAHWRPEDLTHPRQLRRVCFPLRHFELAPRTRRPLRPIPWSPSPALVESISPADRVVSLRFSQW